MVGQEYHSCSKHAFFFLALVVGISQLKRKAILLPPVQKNMLSFFLSQSNPKCREHCDYMVWEIFPAFQLTNSNGVLMPFVTVQICFMHQA